MRLDNLIGRVTCSVGEAAELIGVGRSSAYDLVRSGELESVHLHGRRLVLVLPLLRQLGGEELVNIWRGHAA